MRRAIALFAVLAALGAPASGPGASEQARLEAFRKEAAAQRRKLGLEGDQSKLYAQYPAPEVALAAAEVPTACPGQRLTVSLTGRFLPGALFVAQSDAVSLSDERQTATTWQATVTVRPDAAPGDVLLRVVTPVSEAFKLTRLLDVGCRHTWALELSTGERLLVKTTWPEGASTAARADAEWSRGTKRLGVLPLTVRGGGGIFTFERVVSPQERAKRAAAQAGLQADRDYAALRTKLDAEQRLVDSCRTGPTAALGACLKSHGDELARLEAAMAAKEQRALGGLGPAFGCELVRVQEHAGALSGEAERCVGAARATATGTVKAGN
jgi:hypothetical protein